MKNKLRILCLLCVVLMLTAGCDMSSITDFITEFTSSQSHESLLTNAESEDCVTIPEYVTLENDCYGYSPVDYGYQSLDTDLQKKCYEKIAQNIYTIAEKKDKTGRYIIKQICLLNYEMSERDIRQAIFAFEIDNPQIFWLDNTFAYGISEGSTVIQLYSYESASECHNDLVKLEKSVKKIISKLEPGLTEYERELYIHDAVAGSVDYATGVKSIDDGWRYFTSVGALIDKSAVCESYAKSMQLLLAHAGIESILVNGKSKDVLHMWNMVKIDGEWYHLDPTWDDTDDGTIYKYFNLSDEYILKDHTVSKHYSMLTDDEICGTNNKQKELFNLTLPECTSDKNNFFNKNAIVITEIDAQTDEKFINMLVDAVLEKKNKVYLKVDEGQSFEKILDILFYDTPNKYFYYVAEANNKIIEFGYKAQIESEKTTISKDAEMKTVEILITLE